MGNSGKLYITPETRKYLGRAGARLEEWIGDGHVIAVTLSDIAETPDEKLAREKISGESEPESYSVYAEQNLQRLTKIFPGVPMHDFFGSAGYEYNVYNESFMQSLEQNQFCVMHWPTGTQAKDKNFSCMAIAKNIKSISHHISASTKVPVKYFKNDGIRKEELLYFIMAHECTHSRLHKIDHSYQSPIWFQRTKEGNIERLRHEIEADQFAIHQYKKEKFGNGRLEQHYLDIRAIIAIARIDLMCNFNHATGPAWTTGYTENHQTTEAMACDMIDACISISEIIHDEFNMTFYCHQRPVLGRNADAKEYYAALYKVVQTLNQKGAFKTECEQLYADQFIGAMHRRLPSFCPR